MKFIFFFLLVLNFSQSQAQDLSLKDYLALSANPMKINVTLGSEKISKKLKAISGGTLTLTSTNGDSFELTIPPNSLQRDTEITLQKVKNIKHSKLSATANYSSVEISPDGTQLLVPATLVFKPKTTFPINTLTPFSAQANGDETHLAILAGKQTPNEIKISLLHFSNYTISDQATAEEIIDQGLSQMETTRISNWLARKILKSNRTMGDIAKDMDKAFKDSFDNVLLPSILAVNNCASGRSALENFLVWNRQVQILGADPEKYFPKDFDVNLGTMLADTSEQCLEVAKKACYQDHEPVAVANYALRFMRIGELIGSQVTVNRFRNLLDKCSKFKFFMESEIWAGETRQDSMGVTAKSEFDFSMSPLTQEPVIGSIDVESSYINISGFNCEQTFSETKPSEILLKNFLYDNENLDEKKYTVKIGGLTPYSFAKFHCVDQSDPKMAIDLSVPGAPGGTFWGGMFMATHGPTGLNEFDMKTGFYNTKGWEVRHDTKFLSRDYTQTVQDSVNEATTIIIYHTPEAY